MDENEDMEGGTILPGASLDEDEDDGALENGQDKMVTGDPIGDDAFEDEEGEPVGIICFWSEKALANSCIDEEWKNYQISEVKISDFLENWCVGMSNDELIVGTNFDRNLFGYEIEPLDLILEVTTELKSQNKNVEFRKFDNIDDLKNQVENSIR